MTLRILHNNHESHAHTHIHTHANIHTHTHIHIHTRTHTYIHIHTYTPSGSTANKLCMVCMSSALRYGTEAICRGAAIYIIHHTSHIIHHTSYTYIIHHTSYIIHHTSHIIHHTCLSNARGVLAVNGNIEKAIAYRDTPKLHTSQRSSYAREFAADVNTSGGQYNNVPVLPDLCIGDPFIHHTSYIIHHTSHTHHHTHIAHISQTHHHTYIMHTHTHILHTYLSYDFHQNHTTTHSVSHQEMSSITNFQV